MLLPTLWFACTQEPAPGETGEVDSDAPEVTVPRVERVVIAVLDGARYAETFGLEPTSASEVAGRDLFGEFAEAMLPTGTLVTTAVATGYTLTAPGHADIVTGTRNQFGLMAAAAGPAYYRPEYPTLFEAVEAARPGTSTHLVANTMHVDALFASVYPGSTAASGATLTTTNTDTDNSDATVTSAIRAILEAGDTPLIVANLHDIDRSGHSTTNRGAYAHGLEAAAPELAATWSWIQSEASGLADTTALFVVADHGRHEWDDDDEGSWDYSSHGDQCVGCRDIPIFVSGPGIRKGAEIEVIATLDDVGATAAALLGVPLPHATGRVITELFEATPDVSTPGPAWLARDGAHLAVSEAQGLAELRYRVSIDGRPVGADVLAAEEPAILDAEAGLVSCWRELALQPSEGAWPWKPSCARLDDSGTTALATIPREIAPTWRATLAPGPGDAVLLAWADNSDGLVEAAGFAEVTVASWDPSASWEPSVLGRQSAIFPGHPTVATVGDRVIVAWAASDAGADESGTVTLNPARYTRHVAVSAVGSTPAEAWTPLWRSFTESCAAEAECNDDAPTTDSDGAAWGRMEFPALTASSGVLALAWVSWGEGGVTVHATASEPPYSAWSTPTRVDDTGRVLGHIEPVWAGERLHYARLAGGGTVEVCGWSSGGTATCIDTGALGARDLASGPGVVTLLGWDGETWTAADYAAP